MILRNCLDSYSNKDVLVGEANLHGFINCDAMTLWRRGMLQIHACESLSTAVCTWNMKWHNLHC